MRASIRFAWVVALAMAGYGAVWAAGAEPKSAESKDPIVALPPFTVEEGLPWRYGRVAEFEVLTLCTPEITEEFVEAQYRGYDFLPQVFQADRSRPVEVVLWGGKTTILPSTRKHGYADSGYKFGPGYLNGCYFPDIVAIGDGDSLVLSANLKSVTEYEPAAIQYARRAMAEKVPAIPLWVREGFCGDNGVFPRDLGIQVYRRDVLANHSAAGVMLLPCIPWEGPEPNRKFPARALIPFREFFRGPPTELDANRIKHWRSQAGLFVRWSLFGREGSRANIDGFWRLAAISWRGAVTEEDFKQCMGLNFTEAAEKIGIYLADKQWDVPELQIPSLAADLPAFADFVLRPASDVEIARLKGNFERMQMNTLRSGYPDLAAQYEAAARRTLTRARDQGMTDPAFLAVLGQFEYDTGQLDAARGHLETAAAAKQAGTRALVELARLRLRELQGRRASGEKLSSDEVDQVLTPLFGARDREPVIPEIYAMIGEVWESSATLPNRNHLAVLIEGTRLFPENRALVLRAAEIHRRFGFREEATTIAERGKATAVTDDERAPFAELLEAMRREKR